MLRDPETPALSAGGIDTPQQLANAIGRNAGHALLFVALQPGGRPARAPGVQATLRLLEDFSSLGATGELNRAFHCRAEFYAPGYDWIPSNQPTCGRRYSKKKLSPDDSKLAVLKKLQFGFWEMNWIGLNTALEVIPRDSKGKRHPVPGDPVRGDRRRRTSRYHRRRTLRSQHPRQPNGQLTQ